MNFGNYMADVIGRLVVIAFLIGFVLALGGFFGISWLVENVSITIGQQD